jgi:ribosomal protein L7Ae-like RNA K-turn-binding protein
MENILNNLGLCNRAGGLISGEALVTEGILSKKVCYVFLASDAGTNTKKKIIDKSRTYGVEVNESFTSMELSNAIGRENRMVIGITKSNFLKILKK